MSSTTGIQNFLVNVFRPVYVYDPATTLFTPKLELSNIDTYSGNSVSVFTAAVGDSASNVYVGSNAGNLYTNLRNTSNTTALGFSAGNAISNVSNSTYLGFNAGAGALSASAVIGIGANVGGAGTSNIFIGNGTKSTGNGNILIGHGIDIGTGSNTLRVGGTIYGNLSSNWVGIGTSTPFNNEITSRFDVSGNARVQGQMGINMVPIYTLDVNGQFRVQDSSTNSLEFIDGVTLSSDGFTSIRGSRIVSGGVATIGVLKKGVVLISAVDSADSANRASRMVFAYTLSDVTDIGSNSAGDTTITFSTSNIQITDATNGTYTYSITYFPLP
jgi:hypothetical protein